MVKPAQDAILELEERPFKESGLLFTWMSDVALIRASHGSLP